MPPERVHPRQPASRSSAIEPLEARVAPAFTGVISGGVLTISGDAAGSGEAAQLSLKTGNSGILVLTNLSPATSTTEFSLAGIASISVLGRAGNDALTLSLREGPIANATRTFSFDGGGDALDTLNVFGTTGGAAGWSPSATANAGSITYASSTYTYQNAPGGALIGYVGPVTVLAPAGADDYSVEADVITTTGGKQQLKLGSVSNVIIDLGSNDVDNPIGDKFTVGATNQPFDSLTVKLGTGDDLLTFGASATGSTYLPLITAEGGGGSDTVAIATDEQLWTLNEDSIYFGVNEVDLKDFSIAKLSSSIPASFHVLWKKTAFLSGGAGSGVTETADATTDMKVYDDRIERAGAGTIYLTNIATLRVLPGANTTVDLSGWSGTSTFLGGYPNVTLVDTHNTAAYSAVFGTLDRGAGLGDVKLSPGPTLLKLTTSFPGASFTLIGYSGAAELSATGGSGKLINQESVAQLILSDGLLDRGSVLGTVKLAGFTDASLTMTKSPSTFDVSAWSGSATTDASQTRVGSMTVGGTLVAQNDAASFHLTDSTLKRTGHGDVTLINILTANLTGGSNANTFDIAGWHHGGSFDGAGGTDTIIDSGDVNFTLSPSSLSRGTTSLPIANIEKAQLTGGTSGNKFDISLWPGGGAIDGGSGTDVIVATTDVSKFVLSSGLLQRAGLGDFALTSIESATLAGGPSDNAFDVSGWTAGGSLNGGGGGDTLIASNSSAMTLSNSQFVRATLPALSLTSIEQAILSNPVSTGSFDVGGWTGFGTLAGAGGNALIAASNVAAFQLADTLLKRTGYGDLVLSGFGTATLTGSQTSFDLSAWTGVANLISTSGNGTIVAFSDVDFALRDDSLERTGHGDIKLIGITTANLTGGPSANLFDLTGFHTCANVDGGGGNDELRVLQAGDAMLVLGNVSFGTAQVAVQSIEHFDLEGASFTYRGDDTPRDVVWSPVYGITRSGVLTITDASGTTTVDYTGPLSLSHITTLTLLTPDGLDRLDLSSANGVGTIGRFFLDGAATTALGTFTAVRNVFLDLDKNDTAAENDFVAIGVLAVDGLQNLTISAGRGDDYLNFGTGFENWRLPVSGGAFLFDGGAGNDTVASTCDDGPLILSPTQLSTPVGGALAYHGVENFDLFSPNGITFSGTGIESLDWRPAGYHDGTVGFTSEGAPVLLHYRSDLTLTNAASLVLTTPAGDSEFFLDASAGVGTLSRAYILPGQYVTETTKFSRIAELTVDLGSNDDPQGIVASDTLHVASLAIEGLQHLTYTAGPGEDYLRLEADLGSVPTGVITFDGGPGRDHLSANADVSMVVTESALEYQDNTSNHATLGRVSWAPGSVEELVLNGGSSANRFQIVQSSADLWVAGAAGDDLFEFTGSGHSGSATSYVWGEGGDDTFVVQSTTGRSIEGAADGVTFFGGNGNDTIRAAGDLNFHLTDTELRRVIVPKNGLPTVVTTYHDSIENAVLIGGNSPNLLNALAFSGHADLIGEGGVDNLIASQGGGALYGFHYGTAATDSEQHDRALYGRDNFYAPDGTLDARVELHANDVAGNVISFRYYESGNAAGVNYILPYSATGAERLVSGKGHAALSVGLAEGQLNAIEGSRYADHLTGNSKTNFLIGLAGDDTLTAVGFDYLYGGAGADRFLGFTPFKFQDAGYTIPQTTGATAIPIRPLAAQATARDFLDSIPGFFPPGAI